MYQSRHGRDNPFNVGDFVVVTRGMSVRGLFVPALPVYVVLDTINTGNYALAPPARQLIKIGDPITLVYVGTYSSERFDKHGGEQCSK